MNFSIRKATAKDAKTINELLLRLSDFPLPAWRQIEEIPQSEAPVVSAWANGDAPNVEIYVACEPDNIDKILGTLILRFETESLSKLPYVHIEVITVAQEAQGNGIGTAFIEKAESIALTKGLDRITISFFKQNERARILYKKLGYVEEIVKSIKILESKNR